MILLVAHFFTTGKDLKKKISNNIVDSVVVIHFLNNDIQ